MRPIERGAWPQNKHGGNIEYTEYTWARGELIARMGEYCSYCEVRLPVALAVEHVQPKKPPGAVAVDEERASAWHNFLLACTNCNSTKGNTEVDLDDHLWPDRDNTFRAIMYSEGGIVSVVPGVAERQANKIIKLVGLDKTPDSDKASDRRWIKRRTAWGKATRAKENLKRCNCDEMRSQIIETAESEGFWSIWMTVFKDDHEMLLRLIDVLPGTSKACFGATHQPIARTGGKC